MNKSIENIVETTESNKVREYAAKLMAWGGKKVRAKFVKKDGSVRTMICVPKNGWNNTNGIESTKSGIKMVMTKCANGMATVSEWLGDGQFQPRTLNLGTLLSLELV